MDQRTVGQARIFLKLIYKPPYHACCKFPESRNKTVKLYFYFISPILNIMFFVEE